MDVAQAGNVILNPTADSATGLEVQKPIRTSQNLERTLASNDFTRSALFAGTACVSVRLAASANVTGFVATFDNFTAAFLSIPSSVAKYVQLIA